ncbi:MAG TPA: glycosyltransferase family 2 protein [Dongiaceae bacterium]|nr:glycosyltransferase family 2 protein [Dongiaceae bacterium]
MTNPAFTILLPVHRPPALLRYSIDSVLAQERKDFELLVICDGAPPETAAFARDRAAEDVRILVFDHPKGERHGEIYRHHALQTARGLYVCHITDDDLWLPNHLEEVEKLLLDYDFGNLCHVSIHTDGEVRLYLRRLQHDIIRATMLNEPRNYFGLTAAAYRMSAYRKLPIGWSPAPRDLATDLFMWRKFLRLEGITFGTRIAIANATFATSDRRDWPIERREAEMASWAERLVDPLFRERFNQMAFAVAAREAALREQGTQYLQGRVDSLQQELRNAHSAAAEVRTELPVVPSQPSLPSARRGDPRLAVQAEKIARLRRKLARMRRSASWRMTRPLRWIARRLGVKARD